MSAAVEVVVRLKNYRPYEGKENRAVDIWSARPRDMTDLACQMPVSDVVTHVIHDKLPAL